jgi:hypothetical protein
VLAFALCIGCLLISSPSSTLAVAPARRLAWGPRTRSNSDIGNEASLRMKSGIRIRACAFKTKKFVDKPKFNRYATLRGASAHPTLTGRRLS